MPTQRSHRSRQKTAHHKLKRKIGGDFGSDDFMYYPKGTPFEGQPKYLKGDIQKAPKTSWRGRLSRSLTSLGRMFKSRKSLRMSDTKERNVLRDLNIAKELISYGDTNITPRNARWVNGRRA